MYICVYIVFAVFIEVLPRDLPIGTDCLPVSKKVRTETLQDTSYCLLKISKEIIKWFKNT